MIALNQVLCGKYRITGRLAGGGMSTVYTAEDVQLGKLWTVKVLDTKREEYKRLINENGTLDELEILKALDHPLAPRAVDIFTLGSDICIVMDMVKGRTLQQVLDSEGAQSEELAVRWTCDICGLLSYLHANGIIYRDLKPANVILCEDGGVKLVDFGYPTKIVRNGIYSDREAFGTPGYAAPEQVKRYSDERSDIYSAGITLRQLLTGVPPLAKNRKMPGRKQESAISPGLRAIIEKASDSSAKNRFASMDELRDALLNYKKTEIPYIEKLKRKLAVSSALLYSGLSLALCGLLVFEGFYLKDLHEYKSLTLAEDPKEAELLAAAELLPAKTGAYEALAELYSAGGLTESELESLSGLYDSYEKAVFIKNRDYYALNYRLASCILCFDGETGFCDSSARLKKAREYLNRASASGDFSVQAKALLIIERSLSDDGKAEISGESKAASDDPADAVRSLINSQNGLFGKNTADVILSQDAAILNLLLHKRSEIAEKSSASFIEKVLDRIEQDCTELSRSSSDAEAVLSLLKTVREETEER